MILKSDFSFFKKKRAVIWINSKKSKTFGQVNEPETFSFRNGYMNMQDVSAFTDALHIYVAVFDDSWTIRLVTVFELTGRPAHPFHYDE